MTCRSGSKSFHELTTVLDIVPSRYSASLPVASVFLTILLSGSGSRMRNPARRRTARYGDPAPHVEGEQTQSETATRNQVGLTGWKPGSGTGVRSKGNFPALPTFARADKLCRAGEGTTPTNAGPAARSRSIACSARTRQAEVHHRPTEAQCGSGFSERDG